jgi:hypothetical protein
MLDNLTTEQAALIGAVLIIGVVVLLFVIQRLRQRPEADEGARGDLGVDISTLDVEGPTDEFPRLEYFGTPVRLRVIVVAPCGRGSELPPPELLPGLMERLIPGLTEIIANHHPIVRRWSNQLSVPGFNQSFFHKLALPGSGGKGTPWCSAAGRLSVGQQQYLIGMVLNSGKPNGFGPIVIEHEGQWLNTMRVREHEL